MSFIVDEGQSANVTKINDYNVLKIVALYGANSSGKSNFIKAVNYLQRIVGDGWKQILYDPFFNNDDDTEFSIDFAIKDGETQQYQVYTYTLRYNKDGITYESLTKHINKEQVVLFVRDVTKKNPYKIPHPEHLLDDKQLKLANGVLDLWKHTTTPDKSFLKQMVDNNCSKLVAVFSMFKAQSTKEVVLLTRVSSYMGMDNTAHLDFNSATRHYTNHNSFEHGLVGAMQKIGASFDKINKNNDNPSILELISSYTVAGKELKKNFLAAESDGTVKFYNYFALINYIVENGFTLLNDEFDGFFHPLLVKELIHQVNQAKTSCQLIITTHNTMLLDGVLDTPQIYFAAKDDDKQTELYSLADFEGIDNDNKKDIIKKYLAGSFGAIPYFHSIDLLNKG